MTRRSGKPWRWMVAFALLVIALVPQAAYAREYSIDRVDIDATVATDGSLAVDEVRTFDFDGSFHGVYWRIPTGTYEGREVDAVIKSVGEVRNGAKVAFEESDSEANGTYIVFEYADYKEVKLFSAHSDEEVDFYIEYTDLNLASKWEDTAELYWQFVSDGWEEESRNVTCTVHLPVPDGQTVTPVENVRAWGHGPLDAEVSFVGNDIVYEVPGVGSSEYAEARITFPADWLADAQPMSDIRLQTILDEEQRWADEANAQRIRARIMIGGLFGVMTVLPVGTLAIAVLRKRKYRIAHRPQFTDKYFRDVPTDDHPAVLGALYHGGEPGDGEFAGSLMRLTDTGKVQLDLVTYQSKGVFGRKKEHKDYRLVESERVEGGMRGDAKAAGRDRVDRATMDFLFNTVAGHHAQDSSLMGPNGERYVLMDYFEDVARRHPESYDNGYTKWKSSITSTCEARGFFREESGVGSGLPIGLGIANILLAVCLLFVGILFDAPLLPLILLMVFMIGAGVASIILGASMKSLSREAVELKAQLGALRRWLKEFTRLDEAVPQDVVLWDRLLVMATVLGVADEVIEQLKMAMPRLLEDPYFYSYGWYYYGHRYGMRSPIHAATNSFSSAHSVSAAKLASSSDSSGGGGGGGFSGGGGGGFGGGGGGGAF